MSGDRVAIYVPMIPGRGGDAGARIGAPHSVVFGGFSAEALRDRVNDAKAKVVITADGGYRRGAVLKLKEAVDAAVTQTPSVHKVIVVKRVGCGVSWNKEKDVWWHELVAGCSDRCDAEVLDSEHPLFILYTSGSTGKPKGVLHTQAGYLLQAAVTAKLIFDLKEDDLFWCTADIGWVTGHSYVVYGPLANGATSSYGGPLHPGPDRFWSMIARHRVTIFYTAPTAIRTFMRLATSIPPARPFAPTPARHCQ